MKMSELLKSETNIKELLQTVRWTEEGPKVDLAEQAIYELWKLDKKKAIELWEANVPFAPKGVIPGFIVHNAIRDGINFE